MRGDGHEMEHIFTTISKRFETIKVVIHDDFRSIDVLFGRKHEKHNDLYVTVRVTGPRFKAPKDETNIVRSRPREKRSVHSGR